MQIEAGTKDLHELEVRSTNTIVNRIRCRQTLHIQSGASLPGSVTVHCWAGCKFQEALVLARNYRCESSSPAQFPTQSLADIDGRLSGLVFRMVLFTMVMLENILDVLEAFS